MKRISSREGLILVCTLALAILPLVLLGWYIAEKHQGAESQLAQMEPRYARLLGLESQRADIEAVLSQANAARTQYIYPASQDANQTGNAAQQRIRDIFSAAGLQVISSQVLPAKDEKGFDRIPLTVRTEGEMLALQSALAVLTSQMPIIVINDLDIQLQGGYANSDPKVAPRLSAQFGLSVLRERT
ncbi:type II secretion system protein GspM [Acidovorax sp. NCPPB 3576]|uniref:type II secretion system protein GspM n=1 Tax=Acidovorax sp. NCPPB 3576 TaxID=2940488 RepID=UPI00234ABD5E|nr:type II secretion system protein GspM [Acidovorax sp. NCPPB 3576]WCM89170.1 type II secretion system protein GspM [Acidovorax sp. NCPPB 3576]